VTGLVVDRAFVEPLAVGASEVGAVLGCDPWTTPLQLYRRKSGLDDPRPDSEAMTVGRTLEGPVVGLVRDRLPLPIRRNRRTWSHHTAPLFATPDAFVGRDRLLEVKVAGLRSPEAWEPDELPCRHRVQLQAQLAVTGRSAGYVATLVGTELRLVELDADPVVQAGILDAVDVFVGEHLDPGIPPDPLTFDERWLQLLQDADELPVRDVLVGQELQDAGDRILELRELAKRQDDEVAELRADLLEALTLADGDRLVANGWTGKLQTNAGRVDWHAVADELYEVLELATDPPHRDELAELFAQAVARHRSPATSTFVVRSSRRDS